MINNKECIKVVIQKTDTCGLHVEQVVYRVEFGCSALYVCMYVCMSYIPEPL